MKRSSMKPRACSACRPAKPLTVLTKALSDKLSTTSYEHASQPSHAIEQHVPPTAHTKQHRMLRGFVPFVLNETGQYRADAVAMASPGALAGARLGA